MVRDASLRAAPHHEGSEVNDLIPKKRGGLRPALILRSRASFDSHPHPEEPAKRASRRMRVTAQDEERRLEGWGGHLARGAACRKSSFLHADVARMSGSEMRGRSPRISLALIRAT